MSPNRQRTGKASGLSRRGFLGTGAATGIAGEENSLLKTLVESLR